MNKKNRNMRIRNAFEEIFCMRSDLGNDEVISAWRPGLKTGMENDIFGSEIRSGFGEPGGAPHQEFPGVTPIPTGQIS